MLVQNIREVWTCDVDARSRVQRQSRVLLSRVQKTPAGNFPLGKLHHETIDFTNWKSQSNSFSSDGIKKICLRGQWQSEIIQQGRAKFQETEELWG